MPITIEEAVQQVESDIAPLIKRGYSPGDALTILSKAELIIRAGQDVEHWERIEAGMTRTASPASP